MPFSFQKTAIPEVFVVRTNVLSDERGSFAELFKLDALRGAGIHQPLTQVNWSRSKKHVLRGMHYQNPPKAQAKLVGCTFGEVFDVAVDIRKHSSTYGAWVGEYLSSDNKKLLAIPHGFAHGFLVLSEEAEVIYFCDEQYAPEYEGGVAWNDADITIDWPVKAPILAERDAAFPPLREAINNF